MSLGGGGKGGGRGRVGKGRGRERGERGGEKEINCNDPASLLPQLANSKDNWVFRDKIKAD